MRKTLLVKLMPAFTVAFFVLTAVVVDMALSAEEQNALYNSQIKRYRGITDDKVLGEANVPMTLNEQYKMNKTKYKQLRSSNRKMLKLYDEEKVMNQKLRKMLSRQIEEEFRLRAEFKKIQKEFEENQASFMKNEMKKLGDTISDYEKIKDKSNKLTDQMSDNYAQYMEYQKEFKKQQEDFYKKQVEFYEKIDNSFNNQMKEYENIKSEINEQIQ